jgi:hypothetical protein
MSIDRRGKKKKKKKTVHSKNQNKNNKIHHTQSRSRTDDFPASFVFVVDPVPMLLAEFVFASPVDALLLLPLFLACGVGTSGGGTSIELFGVELPRVSVGCDGKSASGFGMSVLK